MRMYDDMKENNVKNLSGGYFSRTEKPYTWRKNY